MKKFLPHIVALIVFAAISMIFFYPQYQGKALRQGDMVRAAGMRQDIEQHKEKYGEHPQWAGRMFGGMPAYLIDMNYDGRYVKSGADVFYRFLGDPASYLFIAMASCYLMLLLFGCNPWLGIIGGVAYGLSAYFPIIIAAGHITKMMALAWIPGLVGAIFYAYRKNRWLGAALAALFAAVEISTSHPQITYYFLFVIIALVINELVVAIKEKRWKGFLGTSGLLAVSAALAIGANAVQLYYVASHTSETIRGASELTSTLDGKHATSGLDKDYATQWSYGIDETANLFIPNVVGGSSSGGFAADGTVAKSLEKYEATDIATQLPAYWGDQPFTEGPVYIGALAIFLAVLALFLLKGRDKWWIIAPSILALFLAWGHNAMWLTDWFLDHFPLYNKFRVPSMMLVVVELTIPLLAVLGLQRILSGDVAKEKILRAIYWSAGICGGFAIFAWLILGNAWDFVAASDAGMKLPEDVLTAMQIERGELLKADALRSLLFVALGAALLFVWVKGWVRQLWVVGGLVALMVFDLFGVDRRFVSADDFMPKHESVVQEPNASDLKVMADTTNYRVADFTTDPFKDARASYFHRSVGGYHAAKLRRYQDLIERHLSRGPVEAAEVYNMLNTKYFITRDTVLMNDQAAGNAWFVDSVAVVDTPDAELAALGDTTFRARQTAIVDKRFENQLVGLNLAADSTASIRMTEYRVNKLTYSTNAVAPGLVVFSEIFYPKGWTAYIDGRQAQYLRADYVLRAMVIPAGAHTIEWRFQAPHYSLILALTRTCSLVIILGTLALVVLNVLKSIKNKKQ